MVVLLVINISCSLDAKQQTILKPVLFKNHCPILTTMYVAKVFTVHRFLSLPILTLAGVDLGLRHALTEKAFLFLVFNTP